MPMIVHQSKSIGEHQLNINARYGPSMLQRCPEQRSSGNQVSAQFRLSTKKPTLASRFHPLA